jgi:Cu-Zn family superoxide dismutase
LAEALPPISPDALVVHANADDYRSQPAGNAGVRIARRDPAVR